jgi:GDP-D-mannose dehydratase
LTNSALTTGVTGLDGSHLAEFFLEVGYDAPGPEGESHQIQNAYFVIIKPICAVVAQCV